MCEKSKKTSPDLGLDLTAHDTFLETFACSYRNLFHTQPNRPHTKDYFDFVMGELHGPRVKELRDEKAGRKVIGSFRVFVPEETVRAAGATLVGLRTGADSATEEVEKILPINTCAS
jgi:hypothetical protein